MAWRIIGTTGEARAIEAVEVRSYGGFDICLQAHLRDVGWQGQACSSSAKGLSARVGTTGQGRPMEALTISVRSVFGPGTYTARKVTAVGHLQNIGWTSQWWNGVTPSPTTQVTVGTTGQARPLEAVAIAVM